MRWLPFGSEYKGINGFRIPTRGEAIWNLDSGDFSYIKVEITDIEYNNTGTECTIH